MYLVEFLKDIPHVQSAKFGIDAVFGYLLGWLILLKYYDLANNEIRNSIISSLRDTSVLTTIMSFIFRFTLFEKRQDSDKILFSSVDEVNVDNSQSLSNFCFNVFYNTAQLLPALIRQWFNSDCDRSTAAKVDKFVTKNISPLLLSLEIEKMNPANFTTDNIKVRARLVTEGGEVTAQYVKDDISLEVSLKLPASYPLRGIEVECIKKVGLTEAQWRKWVLSMNTLLLHQNGSILDAVILWQQNVDKHFEGVEDCPICYSIIHVSNHSLPRLTCRTCKNKFHSVCLYKWFNTSHKNTCPLCTNPFYD